MTSLSFLYASLLLLSGLAAPPAQSGQDKLTVHVQFVNDHTDNSLIGYDLRRPLRYTDFQAQPASLDNRTVAVTHSEIGYRMRTRTTGHYTDATVLVYVGMNPTLSWMRPAWRKPEVLRHEQLHFDLSALWACRMKHRIETASFSAGQFRDQLAAISTAYQDSCWTEQVQYDRETAHSVNKTEQARWETEIAVRLQEQECFLH